MAAISQNREYRKGCKPLDPSGKPFNLPPLITAQWKQVSFNPVYSSSAEYGNNCLVGGADLSPAINTAICIQSCIQHGRKGRLRSKLRVRAYVCSSLVARRLIPTLLVDKETLLFSPSPCSDYIKHTRGEEQTMTRGWMWDRGGSREEKGEGKSGLQEERSALGHREQN